MALTPALNVASPVTDRLAPAASLMAPAEVSVRLEAATAARSVAESSLTVMAPPVRFS